MDLSIFKGLSIDGVPLKELRANGKLIWSALTKWAKYSCEITEAHYEDTEVSDLYFNSWYDSSIPLYDSFEFSSEVGYSGIGLNTFYTTDDLTEAVGKYHVTDERVVEITSLVKDNSWFDYEGTKVRERTYFDTTYSKGSTSYGTVEAETGALPEDGTLIEGSVADGYCVLEIGGAYYYYVMEV